MAPGTILPKDEEVLNIVERKIAAGEKVLIYTNWPRLDSQMRLQTLLTARGWNTIIMPAKVKPAKREQWVADRLSAGLQVLIANPTLVQTGLDLNAFIRTPEIRYNDVLIQEFPYKENTPESVGRWRPLIEELVKLTLAKYRTLDGLARAYPQWVPEETVLPFPRQALESAEHIIFHDNGICEMIPRAGSSKANIVPPTAADCGEEC